MDVLEEIRSDLVNHNVKLSNIIRKTIVLAKEYEIPELKQWALWELDGYKFYETLPAYRFISVNCFGKWSNGKETLQNYRVPIEKIYNETLLNLLTTYHFPDGVHSLESIIDNKENRFPLPMNLVGSVNEVVSSNGYSFTEIDYAISIYKIEQLLDTIKTSLLDFVLLLKDIPPKRDDTTTKPYHQARYFTPKTLANGDLSGILEIIVNRFTINPDDTKIKFIEWSGTTEIRKNDKAEFDDIDEICDLSSHFSLSIEFPIDPGADDLGTDTKSVIIEFFGWDESLEIRIQSDTLDLINEIFNSLITQLNLDETRSPRDIALSGLIKKIKILFLAADPIDQTRRRLGEEFATIQEMLQLAKLRDRFDLQQRTSITPERVTQALLDLEPNIVHFSGHGEQNGQLCFENQRGESLPIGTDALARLFEQFREVIKCVVLNACYSELQALAISLYIPYVVGIRNEMNNKAAMVFSRGFYQAVGSGRSFREAFDLGCVQIALEGFSGEPIPLLIERGEVVDRNNRNEPEDSSIIVVNQT